MSRPLTYPIGSHCIVVNNIYGHSFEIGEEVVIIDHVQCDYKVSNGLQEGWVDVRELGKKVLKP